ncbi:phosphatidyl-myo-inositol dimannoside synthase [Burkholderiaceae bacterium]|nr:phosphatidyl-myo-inositol dimannoside synthase [Burkholderiaceae bacterium]
MKIVHVVESLDIGGLENVVIALARAQRARGHEVRIVCLWHPGALAASASGEGIAVSSADKRPGFDLRALRRLRGKICDDGADVLHSHNPMAHYYAVAATLGRRAACVLNTRHGMGSGRLDARRERLYRFALRASDFGVSVCEAAQERFVAHGVIPADQAVVVPNGIDLARFQPRDEIASARLRHELGLPAGGTLFGTVGRLNEAKQQHLLLKALRQLLDGGVAASLVMVGDGELRGALEAECRRLGLEPHVRLLGARSDVPDLLAAMDVFMLPSRTEGYSLALVEASAAGLPIIASDVGGNREIVKDGLTGVIVPSGDVGRLAAAMKALAQDAGWRAALGGQGRAWAVREGSLDAMCERYMALYARRVPVETQAAGGALQRAANRRS